MNVCKHQYLIQLNIKKSKMISYVSQEKYVRIFPVFEKTRDISWLNYGSTQTPKRVKADSLSVMDFVRSSFKILIVGVNRILKKR